MEAAEIHFVPLDVEPSRLRDLTSLLTGEEHERSARFKFDRHRNRFIACRGALRHLLDMKPGQNFIYGPYGKPALDGSEIRFNVSHSYDMGMIAITRGKEIGCDIERIEPSFAELGIPERFFSPYEVAALLTLPAEEQCAAFFRCWTRKEAYIKACGMGVSLPLDSFDVTLAPGESAAFLRGADGWILHDVQAPEGYQAALVVAN